MEIGNDDLDYDDVISNETNTTTQDIEDTSSQLDESTLETNNSEDDIIAELLRQRGITDTAKIKYENESGEIEEISWENLPKEDKLNILSVPEVISNETELDDTEIELINAIRSSKMSPAEYMNYVQRRGIETYLQNTNPIKGTSSVDEIDDDTLFVSDILARVGEENITDQELQDLLDNAKSNPALFQKQIGAIRNEYRQIEDQNRQQEYEFNRQAQVQQYNQFAERVEQEIRNFSNFGGYDLNMDESEMEELYDFITGFDDAGVSIFGKALNDPELLVKMGWFILHGEEAIQDINNYWSSEIRERSKNARNTQKKDVASNLTVRKKSENTSHSYDDLDEF